MLWTIAVVVLVLWLLGFTLLPAAGSLIHILLVIAVILVVVQLVSGKKL
ncbi:lmo0937 family membrane protein [Trichococcus alkaliphilus]|nr:lmo0937 family membrane protein [Trichococcus alkaliphilus]